MPFARPLRLTTWRAFALALCWQLSGISAALALPTATLEKKVRNLSCELALTPSAKADFTLTQDEVALMQAVFRDGTEEEISEILALIEQSNSTTLPETSPRMMSPSERDRSLLENLSRSRTSALQRLKYGIQQFKHWNLSDILGLFAMGPVGVGVGIAFAYLSGVEAFGYAFYALGALASASGVKVTWDEMWRYQIPNSSAQLIANRVARLKLGTRERINRAIEQIVDRRRVISPELLARIGDGSVPNVLQVDRGQGLVRLLGAGQSATAPREIAAPQVTQARLDADLDQLVIIQPNGDARILRASSGNELQTISGAYVYLAPLTDESSDFILALSEQAAFSATPMGELYRHEPIDGPIRVGKLPSPARAMVASRDGTRLVVLLANGHVQVWASTFYSSTPLHEIAVPVRGAALRNVKLALSDEDRTLTIDYPNKKNAPAPTRIFESILPENAGTIELPIVTVLEDLAQDQFFRLSEIGKTRLGERALAAIQAKARDPQLAIAPDLRLQVLLARHVDSIASLPVDWLSLFTIDELKAIATNIRD